MKERLARLWPHLRAAFVVTHVVAVLVAATPSTGAALKRAAWADPTVQAEFGAWAPRLGMTSEALQDRAWAFAVAWNDGRQAVLRPFRAYFDLVGATQSWQMFVAPHTFPTRLWIEERRGEGEWTPLFVERSPEHAWMADALGVERLRASIFRWGWSSYATSYRKACTALANRRLAEVPDVTAVRCRFEKTPTPTAAEVQAGKVPESTWVFPFVVERK